MGPGGEPHVRRGQISHLASPSICHISVDLIPLCAVAAIISDDMTAACGTRLHLEVKPALACIKNTFLSPEPLGGGSISSRRSIWCIESRGAAQMIEQWILGLKPSFQIKCQWATSKTAHFSDIMVDDVQNSNLCSSGDEPRSRYLLASMSPQIVSREKNGNRDFSRQ